jgi:hypothetical protein
MTDDDDVAPPWKRRGHIPSLSSRAGGRAGTTNYLPN